MALTAKQEKFAQGILSGMTGADAYRSAYPVEKWLPNSIHNHASKLLANAKVIARIEELRAPAIQKAGITLESHLARLEHLGRLAEENGQLNAAITAEFNRGKVIGLYVDKVDMTVHAGLADRMKEADARLGIEAS